MYNIYKYKLIYIYTHIHIFCMYIYIYTYVHICMHKYIYTSYMHTSCPFSQRSVAYGEVHRLKFRPAWRSKTSVTCGQGLNSETSGPDGPADWHGLENHGKHRSYLPVAWETSIEIAISGHLSEVVFDLFFLFNWPCGQETLKRLSCNWLPFPHGFLGNMESKSSKPLPLNHFQTMIYIVCFCGNVKCKYGDHWQLLVNLNQ